MRINDSIEFFRMWMEPLAIGSHSVYRGRVWKLTAWDAYVDMRDERHWMKLTWMHGDDALCIKMPDKRRLDEFEADYLDIVPGVAAGLNDPVLARIGASVDWFNWGMIQENI